MKKLGIILVCCVNKLSVQYVLDPHFSQNLFCPRFSCPCSLLKNNETLTTPHTVRHIHAVLWKSSLHRCQFKTAAVHPSSSERSAVRGKSFHNAGEWSTTEEQERQWLEFTNVYLKWDSDRQILITMLYCVSHNFSLWRELIPSSFLWCCVNLKITKMFNSKCQVVESSQLS